MKKFKLFLAYAAKVVLIFLTVVGAISTIGAFGIVIYEVVINSHDWQLVMSDYDKGFYFTFVTVPTGLFGFSFLGWMYLTDNVIPSIKNRIK